MKTEIVWKELNCPLLGGSLCERSACVAATCGNTYDTKFHDRLETRVIKKPVFEYETIETGWWIFKKKERIEKTTYIEIEQVRPHFSKTVLTSYIVCNQHKENNIGVKIQIKDIDEYESWFNKDEWEKWYSVCFPNVNRLDEVLEEKRASIEKQCIYEETPDE